MVYTLSLRSVKDLNIEAAVTVSFPLFMQMLRMRSVSNAAANLRHGVVTSLGYRDVSTSLSAGDKSTLQLSVLPVSASASAGAGPRSAQSSPGQKLVQLKVERNDSARSEKISPQQETPVADVASKDEQEETSRKQTTRRRQKWIALTVAALCTAAGLALVSSTSFRIARQKSVCEDTVGPVVWSAVHKQVQHAKWRVCAEYHTHFRLLCRYTSVTACSLQPLATGELWPVVRYIHMCDGLTYRRWCTGEGRRNCSWPASNCLRSAPA